MKLEEILKKMTLQEKLTFLTGANAWQTVGFPKLGVPQVTVSDGPHGLRKDITEKDGTCHPADVICFPTAVDIASTWNPELVYQIGQALAGDCIQYGVDVLLGPGVNMKRSPLCGRNFEYLSEDPCLAGTLGTAYIKGLQDRGVGACLKHFAGNNQEADRLYGGSEIDERTLREIYLRAFEQIVKEAHPWSMMCAYNRLNGVYCSQNPWLLDEVLRKEWGYKGVVFSDWHAVHDRAAALKASLELQMPYTEDAYPHLEKAYQAGQITDAEIDRAVLNLLRFVERVQEEKAKRTPVKDHKKESLAVAKKAAAEAVVLLKNEDGVLPIDEKKVKKVAVVGGCAETPFIQGAGSANVGTTYIEAPLDEIRKIVGKKLDYHVGYTWWQGLFHPAMTQYREALDTVAGADVAVVFVGEIDGLEREGEDRNSIRLYPGLERLILDVAKVNPNTVVVVEAGSAIDMSLWEKQVKGILFAGYAGSCVGSAVADILFGRINPSGKLSETFPNCLEDTPAAGHYPELPVAVYREGPMIGYRYYDWADKNVLFPFGHGLSYTEFAYSELTVSPKKMGKDTSSVKVSFAVKNTGNMAGKEVVQLYVGDVSASVERPFKELRRFQKITLLPGEEKKVSFTLDKRDFAYYSTVYHDWIIEDGKFRILVGASSQDIRLSAFIEAE